MNKKENTLHARLRNMSGACLRVFVSDYRYDRSLQTGTAHLLRWKYIYGNSTATIRSTAVRETGVHRHRWGPIEGPMVPHYYYYRIEGVLGGSVFPHYAERR